MKKPKIVIIESEANIRKLIKSALGLDYTYYEAENGDQALELIRRHKPDLVLLDIMMPQPGAYTICSHIKDKHAAGEIPIVSSTVGINNSSDIPASQAGAYGYLTKPFDIGQLRRDIKNHLNGEKQQ